MAHRTVTTTATGQACEDAEIAELHLKATGQGRSPGSARETARDRSSAVREALSDAGFLNEHLRETGFTLHESDGFLADDEAPPYYAVAELELTCDPAKVDDLLVTATDAGAEVEDVRFALRDATRDELRDRALEAAMERARRKAETIAAAEGLSVGPVCEVRQQEGDPSTDRLDDIEFDSGCAFQPSPIEVVTSVEVVYEHEGSD